jgi:hypothetical protein
VPGRRRADRTYVCGTPIADHTVNEANFSGGYDIGGLGLGTGRDVAIVAWTGQVTKGLLMGLDAIKSNT